jgi:hypothetical protein
MEARSDMLTLRNDSLRPPQRLAGFPNTMYANLVDHAIECVAKHTIQSVAGGDDGRKQWLSSFAFVRSTLCVRGHMSNAQVKR